MKRILVASDLSPSSANALARAIGLAAQGGAALRIVHAAVEPEAGDAHSSLHRKVVTEARIMAEELTDRSIDISARICSAGPAHAILQEALWFDADLVILGTHGEIRFRDALFGTTGSYVVRHCLCPVLVVRSPAFQPYAKALVAIEDVADAPAILGSALCVAPAAEVFALHAFSPTLRQTLGGQPEIGRQEAAQELDLEKALGAIMAGRTPAKVSAERHGIVETGDALEVIMKETAAIAPDLLVMGTRRQALYFDSHAVDTLFWCTRDILIVPQPEPATNAAMAGA
jgi:nucleotide-binding universal stress UspA family protein